MTTQTDQLQTIPIGKVEGNRIRLTIWDILRALTRWQRDGSSTELPDYGTFDIPDAPRGLEFDDSANVTFTED